MKGKKEIPERDYTIPIVIGLILVGIVLRFYHLDYNSLWLDEVATYTHSSGSLISIWQYMVSSADYSPPLFFVLEWIMIQVAGVSEWTLRFVPALFGVLLIPIMYLVGTEFKDKYTGLVAAGFVAFSPFLVFYSQEARPYSVMIFFIAVEFWFFLRALKNNEIQDWVMFGVIAGVAFWTHFYTLVITVVLLAYLLPNLRKNYKQLGVAISVLVLTTLPLLLAVIPLYIKHSSKGPTYGIQGIGIVYETLKAMSVFADWGLVLCLVLFVLGLVLLPKQDSNKAVLLVWMLAATFIISIYMSYRIPMLPRYLIFLMVPFTLGVAVSSNVFIKTVNTKPIHIVLGLITLFAVISIPFYSGYYSGYSKENWKGIGQDLEKITVPGDIIVPVPDYIRSPLDFYYSSERDGTIELTLSDPTENIPEQGTVYYVMTGDIFAVDKDGRILQWLQQNTQLIRNYGNVRILKGI